MRVMGDSVLLMNTCFQDRVCVGCVSLFASEGGNSMARKVGKYL